ncbi:MAG: hypothetical protein E7640_06400 [Ruminococcaceae bacterium]|nr:hypothetical protein [Oscillospiraceae bacterium]
MKKTICIVACVLFVFALASCGLREATEKARDSVSNLLGALGEGDYEAAAGFMHPSSESATKEAMERFDKGLAEKGIALSEGVTVTEMEDFNFSLSDSYYGGSVYEFEFSAEIGEKKCTVKAEVHENAGGFGVYKINIGSK